MSKISAANAELNITDEDVAGISAAYDYLDIRQNIADQVDKILINALEGPDAEINVSDLSESIISIFERNLPLKPRGLKEIVVA